MRYWDSSALVPVIVKEPASDIVAKWLSQDPEIATWYLSATELMSTLCRKQREGAFDEATLSKAIQQRDDLLRGVSLIGAHTRIVSTAERLLRTHPLRAADALQLAAAIFSVDRIGIEAEF